MDKKLSAQDYMEILKAKRNSGTYDYADRVFYDGKLMMKCPGGTSKVGKTCIPKGVEKTEQKGGKRWKKDLGGVNPNQVQKLGKAKNSQDLQRARKS
jgi:hypothetical protein